MTTPRSWLERRELDWDLTPDEVLALLRDDAHPVALTGTWCGDSDIVASEPIEVRSPPHPLADVLDACDPDVGVDTSTGPGPVFGGGWIGYLGFALSEELVGSPPPPGDPRVLPSWWFGYYDHVVRRERATGAWHFEALWSSERAEALERRFVELSRRAHGPRPPAPAFGCGDFVQRPSSAEHRAAIRHTVEQIGAGDLVQANMCLRLEASFDGDPLDAFCRARAVLDPPYAAFLRVPGGAVASLSPELFLHRRGTGVSTHPIKGTRSRPADTVEAQRQRELLLDSDKDRAENVMIVDLMRNDLSRVSVPGSVTVPRLLAAEAHPGVWHLVSDVSATLTETTTDLDLVTATFPPGSVTGAPKVRALELIAELESTPREVYTGAIGYRSPLGGLELNVAIRTFEFHGSSVWLGSGGGITTRSDDADEYAETLLKAAPLIGALGSRIAPGVSAPASPRPRPASGVTTTMSVLSGRVYDLEEHLARLDASTQRLFGKRLPDFVRREIAATVRPSRSGQLRILARPLGGPLHTTVELQDVGPEPASVRLHFHDVPGGMGEHAWADRRRVVDHVAGLATGEQLLITDGDELLETDRGNLFVVVDGKLRTPPLDGRLLDGVVRDTVIGIAVAAGIPVAQATVRLTDLAAASEVFVTSSVGGVVSVNAVGLEPSTLTVGPVSQFIGSRVEVCDRAAPTPPRQRPGVTRPSPPRLGRGGPRPRIVLVDNYDSFTFNLAHLLMRRSHVEVVRNDEVSVGELAALAPDGIVISPGPCTPAEAGISVAAVRLLGASVPILGVCLGHQAIAVAYGAAVGVTAQPVHGQASAMFHDGHGVLRSMPQGFAAARYHSLVVDESTLPPVLRVTARTAEGLPMGLRHRDHLVEGVQFHPESILTDHGARLVDNFVATTHGARLGAGWVARPSA